MINDIVLRNFRNYQNLNVKFSRKINVFTGANGQGKTNLLEAIYFLGILRSFRTSAVKDLDKINSDGFYLSATVDTGKGWDQLLEVEYTDKRRLRIDGVPVYKASEFIGNLKLVAFVPTDIMLVSEGSPLRRRFINMLISAIKPAYLLALNEYAGALKMRNALLKENFDPAAMAAFEKILAEKGSFIVSQRQDVFADLSHEMVKLLKDIRDDVDGFSLKYSPFSGTADETAYLARFVENREKDIARGYSSFGPHSDDFEFLLNGKSLRHFGSNGQCRMASLCLKMASVTIMDQENPDHPRVVTLVDDVTGDLDEKTTDAFFRVIDKSEQTFFSFTEKPVNEFFNDAEMFNIANGQLKPLS